MKIGPMVGSKYLDNKWKKLNHQEHLRRIKDIKSEVAQLQMKPYALNPKLRGQKKEAENESNDIMIKRNKNRAFLRDRKGKSYSS
jgi:hypothetical protein